MLLPTQKANKFAAISFAVLAFCLCCARKGAPESGRPALVSKRKMISPPRMEALELIYVERAALDEAGKIIYSFKTSE